ncbi:glycosyltransferase family 61 protein [Chitinimonas sp. BJB300]|uniref:glycosyltransferase family 61 protein n=1 Tax=Chitinimonas sp. BJB300 TaxID=1559339 RepID=UPI001304468F|nr:glycosyltransferase family 61 protein [Chitinimonas sp. BJB300]
MKNRLLCKIMQRALTCNNAEKRFFIIFFIFSNRSLYITTPIVWLDELTSVIKIPLLAVTDGMAYSPQYQNHQQQATHVKLPAVYAYVFQRACINANTSSVLTNTNQLVVERSLGPQPDNYIYESGNLVSHDQHAARVRIGRIAYLEAGIFLSGNGSSNYYHWLLEILPKISFLNALPKEYGNYPLLVSEEALKLPSFKQSLTLFAGKHPIILLNKRNNYIVDRLVYINSASMIPFNLAAGAIFSAKDFHISPNTLEFIRSTCLAYLERENGSLSASTRERIFLCRKGSRRKYNQHEVYAVLSQYGFKQVFTEDLSFEEQINLMQSAEFIAGPTGAAWTNLLFCRTGSKALCWMAEEYADFSAFSTLAKLVGVDMRYITFPTGAKSTHELSFKDYILDLNSLKVELENLGLNNPQN